MCKKLYKEIIITHTAEAHSEPSQTIFEKKLRLRDYLYGDFKPGMKFQLNKPDEISSRMVNDNNLKVELRLYAKISSR